MKSTTKKTLKFYIKHIAQYKTMAIIMFICRTIEVSGTMMWALILRYFFNVLSQPGNKDQIAEQLIEVLFLLMGIELLAWIGGRIFSYLLSFFESKIMANIANECFEYLHHHSYNFFNNNFTGALVKKVSRMVNAFENIIDKLLFDFYPLGLKLLIAIGVLTYLHPLLGGIMIVWAVVFLSLNYGLAVYKLKFDIARSKAETKVTARLADTITNNSTVKLFANLAYEKKSFHKLTQDWYEKTLKTWLINNHLEGIQAFLMIGLEFIIFYLAIKLWQQDALTIGDFVLIQSYLLETFIQIWGFGRSIRMVYQDLADAEEMTEILYTPFEIQDRKGAKHLRVLRGKVEFKKVSFSYGEKEEAVVKDLSFITKPGEKIALIGPSGGGKSTIIKLILRLFDIQKGSIFIDDQNIARVTAESLRQNVALVPQDPLLFHRTLLENIRYGRLDASDKEVKAAARLAYIEDFINKLPQGYNTYVGERGIKLSGGQKQRVAIARAILANAKILILDEATSSLDSESEIYIQNALENLTKNKTTFLIAHRLSTIMKADRILVFENGKIIEEGRHGDLLSKKGSLYAKLWSLQSGGYLDK